MDDRVSHSGCGAGRDRGSQRFIQVPWAGKFSDCAPALLSVRTKNGSPLDTVVTGVHFSLFPQWKSFSGVGNPVSGEEKANKAAWKRSKAADHAICLLTLEFFKHLHSLLENNTLYALQK